MAIHYQEYDAIVKKIIERVGKNIVLGIPLGLGKPIGITNAFYRLAVADPSIQLTIITGLTLARPILHNELEKRFIEPILDRILKDYEDPLYEKARLLQQLPDNINVLEFFLMPANYLHNAYVQEHYISSKYTRVVHDATYYSVNVFAQQVTQSNTYPHQYSLSCNTDVFHGIVNYLKTCQSQGKEIAIAAEVNLNLPFMLGDALVNSDVFTDIVDTQHYRALFALPRDELSAQDHLIGFYSSCLIKDNSCLQIGIGKLGSAIASALILRHKENEFYQNVLTQLAVKEKFGEILTIGDNAVFAKGLYSSTEMFSDEFMQLYDAEILKKRVYDNIVLQRLLNTNKISEKVTSELLDILLVEKVIQSPLTEQDVNFLKQFGIFKATVNYQSGHLVLTSGTTLTADLTQQKIKQQIIEQCLGDHLQSGKILHAGFFIGSVDFYQQLRNLPLAELQQIDMTSIARTNRLHWNYELLQLQRQQARLINTTMMITLSGSSISDGLKNLQEVSGVGGQFDFVEMAQNLNNARSIIACHSTRTTKDGTQSNIVWDYPNVTIPRYLRDIFITEYGIADCRSKTDAEVIKSLLNITDSRFQNELLKKAKFYGKLPANYEIPKQFQQNYPEKIRAIVDRLQKQGYCQSYPFGSDLTDEEKILAKALLYLKHCSRFKLVTTIIAAFFSFNKMSKFKTFLTRMKLDHPKTIKDLVYKKLLIYIIGRKN